MTDVLTAHEFGGPWPLEELRRRYPQLGDVALSIRKKCVADPLFLGSEVLGSELFRTPSTAHREVAGSISRCENVLYVDHRGTLKTTLLDVVGTYSLFIRFPNVRVIFLQSNKDIANQISRLVRSHLVQNAKLKAVFPEYALATTDDSNVTSWSHPARQEYTAEGSFNVGTPGATTTGMHYEVIKASDLMNTSTVPPPCGMSTVEQMKAVIAWYASTDGLLVHPKQRRPLCPPPHKSMDCVVAGTPVLMADGSWKPVELVRPGEDVRSWDTVDGWAVGRVLQSGLVKREATYTIKAKGMSICCSGGHELLVLPARQAIVDYCNPPEWRRAEDLKLGDRVVSCRSVETQEPSEYDEEFLWLLGFMWGDGWLVRGRRTLYGGRVDPDCVRGFCVAKKPYEDVNERVLAACERYFGVRPKLGKYGYYRADRKAPARLLFRLGLTEKATKKRVPEWVFRQPLSHRRAFIDGLWTADGYTHDAWRKGHYKMGQSSRGLVEDIRKLTITSGGQVARLLSVTQDTIFPGRPVYHSTSYTLRCNFDTNRESWADVFSWQRVESIARNEEPEDLYDLTVDGVHNYVADGLVVHNSNRWSDGDHVGQILRDDPRPPEDGGYFRKVIRGVTRAADGTWIPTWPEVIPSGDLAKIRASPSMTAATWASNFMSDPLPEGGMAFERKWFHTYGKQRCKNMDWGGKCNEVHAEPDRENLVIAVTVDSAILDPATARGIAKSDRSALVTSGVEAQMPKRLFVLGILAGKWKPGELVEKVFEVCGFWKPRWVGIEDIGAGLAIESMFLAEMLRSDRHVPYRKIKMPGLNRVSSKEARIAPLHSHAEYYGIYVHEDGRHEALVEELLRFGVAEHDDLADALGMRGVDLHSWTPASQKPSTPELTFVPGRKPLTGADIIRRAQDRVHSRRDPPWKSRVRIA